MQTDARQAHALFIASEVYRAANHGRRHPLAIPRVTLAMDLCRALGWLDGESFIDSPMAGEADLARFHDPLYIAAVRAAERDGELPIEAKHRHHIGTNGNPIFDGMFRRPATACGGGLLAARLLMADRARAIYAPGGGQHHGRPDRASGFCYFNEPALTILGLLEHGAERVAYVDIDAHHGDGVQDAFADDPRVLTVSIHEAGRWPMAKNAAGPGSAADRAGGAARNLPVPPGLNDDELDYLIQAAVLPLLAEFEPDAVYLQAGADALADDPQSKLALSNGAIWRAVAALRHAAPRLLVTGGGGYNPYAVGRCWAGIWATLSGHAIPAKLPPEAEGCLRDVVWHHRLGRGAPDHWFTTLADPAQRGPVRDEIKTLARTTLEP